MVEILSRARNRRAAGATNKVIVRQAEALAGFIPGDVRRRMPGMSVTDAGLAEARARRLEGSDVASVTPVVMAVGAGAPRRARLGLSARARHYDI